MKNPTLYRRRIIPQECVLLKDDLILLCENDMIVTKWNALKPKRDLHHGYSCYYLKEGFKISKFYKEDNSLLYWYCDIITSSYNAEANELIVTDLLADVIIYPDGLVKVIDLDEFVPALDSGELSVEQLKKALLSLDQLLSIIYSERFHELTAALEELEEA